MNQNTVYIAIGIIVVLLIGLWAFNARKADAPAEDVATTTAETTDNPSTSSGQVTNNKQPTITNNAPQARGVLVDGTYALSAEESVIGWIGRKPRVLGYEDTGTLKLESGSVVVSNGHITSGSFVIDMTTLAVDSTGNNKSGDMLVGHLSSDDFFSVETYPTASFVVKNVINNVVTGELTIKNTTKMISFPATITETEGQLSAQASITLNRAQWDIRYGSGSFFDNLGDNLIADEVSITLDLVATK